MIIPVCCSREAATPPSMKISPASTDAAGDEAAPRAERQHARAAHQQMREHEEIEFCIDAAGRSRAKRKKVGVKISDCGSATGGWPAK